MAIGLVTSLPSARSTFARISSPGSTFSFPACLARIFSVSVMPMNVCLAFPRSPPPSPQGPYQLPYRPGDDVHRDEQEDHHLGLRGHQEGEKDEHHQGIERPAAERLQILEVVVLDRADHEKRQNVDGEEHGDVLEVSGPAQVIEEQDHGGDERRRGRNRQPVELPLLDRVDLDVESGEPERPADQVEERRQPPPTPEAREGPTVDEERRRDAERDEVGQGVVLHPELRGRLGHPGDPAVEAVEHHSHDDGRRGLLELAGVGRGDRVEPREQRSRRDQVGQYVDPPTDPVLPSDPSSHGSTPTTLSPARTRSPSRTEREAEAGSRMSTREPNRMSPTRCPARTTSPGTRSHTIRRAMSPAIWT